MKNRIGIITFHESPNYGALLQAYALKTYIEGLGYEVCFINYKNKKRQYAQVHGLRKVRSIIWNLTFYKLLSSKKRAARTNEFREEYLPITSSCYTSEEEIKKNPPDLDVYITGSDQVWNPRNTNGDQTYFLDFVPQGKKKISFAPSFGAASISDSFMEKCKDNVSDIDFLSVRERKGAELVRKMLGRNAEVVCDPVFLLSPVQWHDISKRVISGKYILCYYMPGDSIVESGIAAIANSLSKQTGYPIINIGKKEYERVKFWNKNQRYDLGPAEFVAAIENAEYVITNSFHGSAFSLIFEKPLFVPYRADLPAEKALNNRIIELLKSADCEKCLFDCSHLCSVSFEFNPEYLDRTNPKMEVQIEKSKEFLMRALEDEVV